MAGENLDEIRKMGLLVSEKRYYALETMRAIIEWVRLSKPSELISYEEKSGKETITKFAVEEPKMRELWQKWGDTVTKVIFEKGAQIPELLVDDIIALFKAPQNNK